MVAIFSYGFDIAKENFKKEKCTLHTLSDYGCLIQQALDSNYITKGDLDSLKEWRDEPEVWMQN